MDYEKRYKEALERAKNIYGASESKDILSTLTTIFPSLKESEDEKIRKEITEYFKHYSGGDNISIKFQKWIAWLEKQGEQKQDPCKECDFPKLNCENFPCINKKEFEQGKSVFDATNEPKFKVGDWIVNSNGKVNQVTCVNQYGDGYTLDDKTYMSGSWCNSYHLWTIEDAKDGDVLVDGNFVGIFKENSYNPSDNSGCMYLYCSFDINNDKFYLESGGYNPTYFYPATKEQRGLLFQKMHEAGYEWNAEKKELKKIHVIDEAKAEMDYCFTKMMNGEKVSSALSDVDEADLNNIIWLCNNCIEGCEHTWIPSQAIRIKSLIERIKNTVFLQQKQEWSEEDERERKHCVDFLNHPDMIKATPTIANGCKDWLKSLKPQPQWKPSEEQIDVLNMVITDEAMDDNVKTILKELIIQIKKL